MLKEGVLEWMQVADLSEAFNCGDRTILILHRQREAGVDPLTVDQYRASSAGALVATLLGAVSPKCSRKRSSREVRISASKSKDLPFIKKCMVDSMEPSRPHGVGRRNDERSKKPNAPQETGFHSVPVKQWARRSQVCRLLGFEGLWRLKTRCRSEHLGLPRLQGW